MSHQKKTEQKKSFMFDHVNEVHQGVVPPITLEIVDRFVGETGIRQAEEAVLIHEQKPPLNGKEEWTDLPRKRREQPTVTSNEPVTST